MSANRWTEFEGEYAKNFPTEMGAPAKAYRMALGALIIKEKLGTSDRETVEQIRENRYLQYFIGLEEYQDEAPFDASMIVHFRQRIGREIINQINGKIVAENRTQEREEQDEKKSTKDSENVIKEKRKRGKLIVDASCAPADVKYPTDLDLLATARVESEKIIDILD